MLISTKGRYALRVMADLARNGGEEYVVLMDIAERQNISEKYLEGIVAALSRCGFLQTQRGRGGGYRLARCPEEYAVGDILRVAEGSIAPVSCVKSGESECPNADNCLTLPLWKELDRVMNDYLESVTLADGRTLPCDSVVVASGFTLFDASIKEEYGYGIYDNVFTTADIERMLNEGRVAKADGSRPRRIAFLHCVGSRDEKVCQQHCSKVCCITGVKQAMEMKQLFPEADVFNFYMDIRMFGPGYEEMYREAQQRYNIHFLRGRISEASPTIDGRVQIKAEDTLTGRPLRMSVDMLVLIVGMRANDDNEAFAAGAGLNRAPSGFLAPRDMFLGNVKSNVDGIFYAGTITAPKNIGESLNEGIAAADAAAKYVEA